MVWTIYCHTHITSDRKYVGQTKHSMESRWRKHVQLAKKPNSDYSHFQNAIRIYGETAFSHEVLEICVSVEEAHEAEKKWIKHFDTTDLKHGFNIDKGGVRLSKRPPKTHCKNGHSLDDAYIRGNGHRMCRVCVLQLNSTRYEIPAPLPTHCVNGHEYTPENTRMQKEIRRCKICYEAARRRSAKNVKARGYVRPDRRKL